MNHLQILRSDRLRAQKGRHTKLGITAYRDLRAKTKIATEQHVQRSVQEILSCSDE